MSESPNSSACLVSCYQAFSLTSELITTQHCAHRCHPSPPIIWLKGLYRLSLGLGGNPCGGKRGGRQSFLTYLVASSLSWVTWSHWVSLDPHCPQPDAVTPNRLTSTHQLTAAITSPVDRAAWKPPCWTHLWLLRSL